MATLQELEEMNLADLQNLANEHMDDAVDEQPAAAQEEEAAHEEQAAAAEEEGEQQEEQQPTVYRRVIDLGDGSGTQVFEGKTQEELIDKLTTAQENASRKIRELSTAKKQTEQERADQEYLLSQELLTKPSEVIRKEVERMFGRDVDSVKKAIEVSEQAAKQQAARDAASKFVESTPGYYDNESNGSRIGRYLNRYGLPFTVENMKKAFEELNADGLLVQRPQEPSAGNGNASAEQPRIATPAQPATPQRRTGSNLSSRGRSVAPPAKKKLTEADLYSMDIDKLQDLANRQLKGELAEE